MTSGLPAVQSACIPTTTNKPMARPVRAGATVANPAIQPAHSPTIIGTESDPNRRTAPGRPRIKLAGDPAGAGPAPSRASPAMETPSTDRRPLVRFGWGQMLCREAAYHQGIAGGTTESARVTACGAALSRSGIIPCARGGRPKGGTTRRSPMMQPGSNGGGSNDLISTPGCWFKACSASRLPDKMTFLPKFLKQSGLSRRKRQRRNGMHSNEEL